MKCKVTVVGAGNVGATLAHRMVDAELADVTLLDVVPDLPQGKGLDILEAAPIAGVASRIVGASSYEATADSHVVVVTSGVARKRGMSRDDLLKTNAEIVRTSVEQAARYSPRAVVIVVSNPLDAMCHVALKASGFPKQRVIGMGGLLDSARMRAFLAQELGVSADDVTAFVLGGHGDTMVPLTRYSTMAGIPITELLAPERIAEIVKRTEQGGAEIVDLLKTASAYYAPAAATFEMVAAVLKDKHKVLPCSCYLEGEYGIQGVYVGVPAQLGQAGLERIWQIGLTESERQALLRSAAAVKKLVDVLKL